MHSALINCDAFLVTLWKLHLSHNYLNEHHVNSTYMLTELVIHKWHQLCVLVYLEEQCFYRASQDSSLHIGRNYSEQHGVYSP